MLHSVSFLGPLGVVEAVKRADKITRYSAGALKSDIFPDRLVNIFDFSPFLRIQQH
jgi:hypothetical protein